MAITELIDNGGFRTGLVLGVVTLGAVVLATVVWRAANRADGPRARTRRGVPATAALGVVAAGILGVAAEYPDLVTTRLVVGLGLLTAAPLAVHRLVTGRWRRVLATAAAAVPGAVVVATAAGAQNAFDWTEPFVLGTVIGGGALVTACDARNARAGLGPVLLAASAFGIYVTLPDTELIAVVLGALIPVAVVGFPIAFAALGPGAYGVVGLLGWVAASGGRGRPGAFVGAMACLGLLLVEPLVRLALRGRTRSLPRPVAVLTVAVIALQCAVAFTIGRTAGLETSARDAAVIALAILVAGALALAALLFRPTRAPRPVPVAATVRAAGPPGGGGT